MQSSQSCADAADAEQALRMGMDSPEWYDSSAVAPEKDTSTCQCVLRHCKRPRGPHAVSSTAGGVQVELCRFDYILMRFSKVLLSSF